MRRNGWKQLLILILVCTTTGGWGQDVPSGSKGQSSGSGDDVDYSVFSLEELFKVNVITASKQEEPLWDAGGVVTVLNHQEIEKFGGNNLWDLVERFAAVQKNYSGGVTSTSIRGGEGVTQNHLLVLIDGRPFRSSNGNYSTYSAWSTFPIDIIERIELVRGPGSVLYGTNAFEGVINVITKKSKRNYISASGKYGSFNSKSYNLSTHYNIKDVTLDLGAYSFKTDGWGFKSGILSNGVPVRDSNGNIQTFEQGFFEDNKGYKALLNYKGLSASVYGGRIKHFGEVFYDGDSISYESKVAMYNISYERQLSEKWRLDINLTSNHEDFDWRWEHPAFQGRPVIAHKVTDRLEEVTLFGKLNDQWRVVMGTVAQQWNGRNPYSDFGYTADYPVEHHLAAYTELTYRPNRFFKFIAGGQFNKPEGLTSDIVPRLGFIWNYTPRVGIKLLYGQAFKSPVAQERFIDSADVQLGFPGLESEKIKTYNAQWFYQGDNQLHVFTIFNSKQNSLIRLLPPTAADLPEFQRFYEGMTEEELLSYPIITKNQGELNVKGAEFESKFTINQNWFITTAISHQENEDQNGVKDTTLAPANLLKGGASYSKESLFLSLFVTHYDKTKDNLVVNPDRIIVNPEPNSFELVTLNAGYEWRAWGNLFKAEVSGQNLLGEEAWVHQAPLENINTIRGHGDRALYIALKVKR